MACEATAGRKAERLNIFQAKTKQKISTDRSPTLIEPVVRIWEIVMNSIFNWGRSSKKAGKVGLVHSLKNGISDKYNNQSAQPHQQQQVVFNELSEKIRQREFLQQAVSRLDQEISELYKSVSDNLLPSSTSQSTLVSLPSPGASVQLFPSQTDDANDILTFQPEAASAKSQSLQQAMGNEKSQFSALGIDPNILNNPEMIAALLKDEYLPVLDDQDDDNLAWDSLLPESTLSVSQANGGGEIIETAGLFTIGSDGVQEQQKMKRGPYKKRDRTDRKCARCGTRESPVWRCRRFGTIMCNACGIWMKTHPGESCSNYTQPQKA